MKQPNRRSDCPISFALDLFGDRWTLLVIRDLMFKGKKNYGEFLQSEERIATNILSDRLSLLEGAGLVTREKDPAKASKIIYRLTERGIDLVPVMVEIIKWSARHDPATAAEMGFVQQANEAREELVASIRRSLLPPPTAEAG